MVVAVLNPDHPAKHHAVVHHGDQIGSQIGTWGMVIGWGAYGLFNLLTSWRFARRKQFGYTALWLTMAVISLLFVLTAIFPSK